MSTSTSRVRLAVSAVVAAGLCLAGTAALAPPTQAATGTCDDPFPVADLVADQPVTGLTVTKGTHPDPVANPSDAFTGTVLGVLKDGIEPGVDMVMADLTSPQIDSSGIWEGMSGSPVYAEDGRLIGAVAYTLSYGSTSIAGITPWQDMNAYAGSPAPLRVAVGAATARTIADATTVTAAQASQGFSELRAPALVAGLGARALARATGRPYLNPEVAPAGRASTSPTAADMVAGGNLVATESTGDIVFGALGTITSVCNDTVVGFGHPMEFVGRSTYGMAGADTLFIQKDPLGSSFKVANIGGLLGSVTQDRMTGISGLIGPAPHQFDVSSLVSYTPNGGVETHRTGVSHVQLPVAAPDVTFYELVANHQDVLDAYQGGTENQTWTVTGHTDAGAFELDGGNRYTDTQDVTFASVWDLPDLLWLLTHVDGVTIDSIDAGSQVSDNTSVLKIQGLQQRRGGRWVTVDGTHPALLKPGQTANLRLRYAGGTVGRRFTMNVPARAAGARGRLYTQESPAYWFEQSFPHTIGGVERLVRTMPRNDQAVYDLWVSGGTTRPVHLHGLTTAESKVLTGQASFKVLVQ